jgi:hypothetical protein
MKLGNIGFALAVSFCALACRTRPEKKRVIAEPPPLPALSPEEQKDFDEEVAELQATPSKFLEAINLGPHGFDNGQRHSRQLGGVTLVNHSRFFAADLEGMTDWLDDKGAIIGSTPLQLVGAIAPGAKKYFATQDKTMTSGTLYLKAASAEVRITHVTLTRQFQTQTQEPRHLAH